MISTTDVMDLASQIEDAAGSLENALDDGDEDQAEEYRDELRDACERMSAAVLDILSEIDGD